MKKTVRSLKSIGVFSSFLSGSGDRHPPHDQKNTNHTEDKMKDRYTDAIQNRFTAYLQAAIANRKASYFGKRNRILAKEIVFEDQSYKSYLDFEIQYICQGNTAFDNQKNRKAVRCRSFLQRCSWYFLFRNLNYLPMRTNRLWLRKR